MDSASALNLGMVVTGAVIGSLTTKLLRDRDRSNSRGIREEAKEVFRESIRGIEERIAHLVDVADKMSKSLIRMENLHATVSGHDLAIRKLEKDLLGLQIDIGEWRKDDRHEMRNEIMNATSGLTVEFGRRLSRLEDGARREQA